MSVTKNEVYIDLSNRLFHQLSDACTEMSLSCDSMDLDPGSKGKCKKADFLEFKNGDDVEEL